MKYRTLGRTGFDVSEISFGAWAIGGSWGETDDAESLAALNRSLDLGINFIDTADVYGDGRSERLIARLRKERPDVTFYVATKAGRRLSPHNADGYNKANLTAFVERSLKNLEVDALDLVQLHCPPTEVYYRPEVFGALDDLVQEGKIRNYGVSVEKVEEALKAIEYPNVKTVQIIFNMLRLRAAGLFFQEAKRRNIGILARVPLASGCSRASCAAIHSSRPTTTASSTAMAKHLTGARPSRAWITSRGCRPSRSCGRWFPKAQPWPSWPCAGFSCLTPSPAPSLGPSARPGGAERRSCRPACAE